MNLDGLDQSTFSQTIAFLYGKWFKYFIPPSMCFLLSFEHSVWTADKRILSLLSTSCSYQCPFCWNAPCTLGPGEQSCTAGKHREVLGNARRAGWRQDLFFIVALPLGEPVSPGGKRMVGGSSGTGSTPGRAVIPGTDTLGLAVCNNHKKNKTPNPTGELG